MLKLIAGNTYSFVVKNNYGLRDRIHVCLEYDIPQHSFLIPHFVTGIYANACQSYGFKDTSVSGYGNVTESPHQQAAILLEKGNDRLLNSLSF